MPPKPPPQPQKPSRPGTARPGEDQRASILKPQRKGSIRSVLRPAPGRQASELSSFYSVRRDVSGRYSVVSVPAEQWIVIPPDGGWGWIVVAAAFIINFLIDGTTYSFGIFLNDISSSFGVHPTQVALANSLMSGFYYFAGPLSCALCNRFGFRIVGVLGGLTSGLLFVYASYCYNLTMFLVVVGFCGGIAFNMVYTPTILVCGFYFERYRALATAISVTGTSIGIMAFPIIINNLFHHLEWRMEFRILAGSFGMIMLLVLIFKPIKPTRVVAKKGTSAVDLSSEDEDSIGSFDFGDVEEDKDVFTLRKIFQNFHNKFFPTMSSNKDSSTTIESKGSKKSAAPSTYFGLPGAIASEASVIRSVFRGDVPEARSVGLSTIYETDDDTYCCCCCRCCRCCKICRCKSHLCQDDFNRPLYRDDIFYTGSIKALPEYRSRVSVVPSVYSSRAVKEMASLNYTLSVSRVVTQRELQQARRCVCCPEAVLRVLSTMLDLKLMKQLSFALLVLSGFFTMVGLYSPFVFIGQRGEELGFTANWNTLLLTIMGISNTVGRIICGVVSTIPRADVMLISWSTLVIAGAATMASAFAPFLEAQIAFSVTYGLLMASFTALRAALIAEMMGLENLTNAFGITIMFYGLGSFVGIPLAGLLQNLTGKYAYGFLFAGGAILLSGILMMPIKKIVAWEASKRKKVTFLSIS